jgi:hypothetical protein
MNISDVGFFKEKFRSQTFFEVPPDSYCTSVNTTYCTSVNTTWCTASASLVQDHAEPAPTFFYLIPILELQRQFFPCLESRNTLKAPQLKLFW